jgi:hypothetical protein
MIKLKSTHAETHSEVEQEFSDIWAALRQARRMAAQLDRRPRYSEIEVTNAAGRRVFYRENY